MSDHGITVQDIYEFLQIFLYSKDYHRLTTVIESRQDFYLSFPLTQPINDIHSIIVFKKNNRFAIQFVPVELENRSDFDKIAPDVIVFVNK